MTPEEIRRETTRLHSLWMLIHPEDGDLPFDVTRRIAAERVMARERRGDPPVSEVAPWPAEDDE